MTQQTRLAEIDVDGAVRESAHEALEALDSGDTRLDFIRKAGLTAGGVVGGGAILGALAAPAIAGNRPSGRLGGDRPPRSFGKGDIGILNYALTLEYLESSFYNEAAGHQHHKDFLHNHQLKVFLNAVKEDENKHVKVLKSVLGSKAVKKPKFDFHGDTSHKGRFIKASFTFENEGVHAYSGQAFNIKDPKVLAAALSIVTVEARHASVIGLIAKESDKGITPNGAFDVPYGANHVLKDVKSLHYIKG